MVTLPTIILVGETGGKDFHVAHKTADVDNFVYNTLRAAFEYQGNGHIAVTFNFQGQKCSACSRCYVPDNIWPEVKQKFITEVAKFKVGQSDGKTPTLLPLTYFRFLLFHVCCY